MHATAATLAVGIRLAEIGKDHPRRQDAKAVNSGLVYGQGVGGLADGLGISKDEAQNVVRPRAPRGRLSAHGALGPSTG